MPIYRRKNNAWALLDGSLPTVPDPTRDALILGAYRPDATTTGVLPGSILTVTSSHTPVDGSTYTNLDIRNTVIPGSTVGNVTYKNCFFRGPAVRPTGTTGLFTAYRPHQRGFVFIDCTFLPQLPDYRWVGVVGYGFKLLRCDISIVVDNVEVYVSSTAAPGENPDGLCDVIIQQCYFHDSAFFAYGITDTSDPRWGGGETSTNGSHSDGIQWEGATGLIVQGNYFTGKLASVYVPGLGGGTNTSTNSAMMIKPDVGAISGATITQNWFSGGSVSVNVADAPTKSRYIDDLGTLSSNRFGHDQLYAPTVILVGTTVSGAHTTIAVTATGNVYDDTSAAVAITRTYA